MEKLPQSGAPCVEFCLVHRPCQRYRCRHQQSFRRRDRPPQLCRRYGSHVALESLNLSIGAGEFFSMLGPSGCGKTTTLRLIAGFDRPDRGPILLQGLELAEAPPHRRPVNLVFQNYALFPHLNVWDNVAFGPRSQRLGEAEIRRSPIARSCWPRPCSTCSWI